MGERRGDDQTAQLREDIACAARAFAALGYVHAFGHVSVRQNSTLLITPTRPPLPSQRPADILETDFDGKVLAGDAATRPIEVFLHIGVYQARADVAAICRTHAPAASLWRGGAIPPIQHGFGGIAANIATYDGVDLIHTLPQGATAAAALGRADGLILRGNGVLTVGSSLGEAAARMWSLEERCAVAMCEGNAGKELSDGELAARQRWYSAEQDRVWRWLQSLGEAAMPFPEQARRLPRRRRACD
jgi:HCOMODA/2-hydroxy-3-carboxy-muconic semialdehyde decarboxylase